jgi:hypothetical protein
MPKYFYINFKRLSTYSGWLPGLAVQNLPSIAILKIKRPYRRIGMVIQIMMPKIYSELVILHVVQPPPLEEDHKQVHAKLSEGRFE